MEIEILIVIILALCIDLTIGELPTPIHPVVWLGKLIEKIKNLFLTNSQIKNKFLGFIMTMFLLCLFALIFYLILWVSSFNQVVFVLISSFLLSTTFAVKSLFRSVSDVGKNLQDDIQKGRDSVSFLVSRDTSKLSSSEVVSAAIETLTENVTDSVIAPLFYIFIFAALGEVLGVLFSSVSMGLWLMAPYDISIFMGVTAGVSYRVVNTLDAMVGYKDPKNIDIGWFPARLDDCLNYVPARITGFLMVVSAIFSVSDYKRAWQVMLNDAHNTPSPNSGYPMAAAAGALNVQLIKPGVYKLGDSNTPLTPEKITEAIKLSIITISLFFTTIFIILLLLILF